MSIDLILRSIVVGAYLVALAVHGSFDLLTGLLVGGFVLIWAVPQVRCAARRRREAPGMPHGAV